ncbi:phosphopantetheine-binding protein, partial [Streptomyces sp. AC154]|uniref:acyl carrier protein n=1 Tax=Streptomyces sp. AC154 TaxID=3143184 RepID=UPI003F7E5D99
SVEGGGRRTPLPSYPFAGESHGAYPLAPVGPAGEQAEAGGPAADLEQQIRALIAEALGLADADDPEMTYFAAGGDSLTAVHLVGCLRDEYGLDVPITLFLEQLTLHEMARRIMAVRDGDDSLDALLAEFEAE